MRKIKKIYNCIKKVAERDRESERKTDNDINRNRQAEIKTESASRAGCSTETALLKVPNDILEAMGESKVVILVL